MNGGTQVSVCEKPKASFMYVEFSADGRSLLTLDIRGANAPGVKGGNRGDIHPGLRSAYEVWNVATGKMIGSSFSRVATGHFTTAALSPDGKYLAMVLNGGSGGNLRPYQVRELTVWEVADHKPVWSLPGETHTGKVAWDDSLAFSPDGKRLAFFLSGDRGPKPEMIAEKAARDSLKALKMLSLEPGQETPSVVYEKRVRGARFAPLELRRPNAVCPRKPCDRSSRPVQRRAATHRRLPDATRNVTGTPR